MKIYTTILDSNLQAFFGLSCVTFLLGQLRTGYSENILLKQN